MRNPLVDEKSETDNTLPGPVYALPLIFLHRLTRLGFIGLFILMHFVGAALAAEPKSIAVLGVEFIDTSLEWQGKPSADELKRINDTQNFLQKRLAEAGYEILAPALVAQMVEPVRKLQMLDRCNGCDVTLGRQLNADWVLIAWVQKVSNLILNLNIIVRDSKTGRDVAGAFVDLRGNTDVSWQRAVRYAMKNILLPRLKSAGSQALRLRRIINDRA